ncbi:MAG: radical SAM protein [Verrucomicrobia bacterium]|nr:MAG: radical SAM protein [Verrucomicrobiota bacterium]TAE85833.1 MAG: radical SAM protein [Verrucomicrobiota bacterium]TAF23360.1 MAG: radical SAM protein [Verrucomicrobiota bacterium]
MNIGYIAMSGLRLVDAELLQLGLSFPAVARRAREIEALPSLGLLTLAAMSPPHIGAEYLEVRDISEVPDRFDAIALSTLSATAKEAYAMAARFREKGIPVILGGLHATLAPDEAARHVDAVVIGEGEPVWPEVLRDLERGDLQPRYDARTRGPFDLRQAPMPRFDLLSPDRYPRFTVQTQRGCPYACEFCAASMRLSPVFRTKPAEKVLAEVRRLKDLFGRPFVEFADDNTFADKRHGRALMAGLAKEGLRWFTETDVSVADDPDLLKAMRDSGCHQVLIGFESPRFASLDGVEKKSNWKARRTDRYLRAVETIQSHGITVNGCFILGLDGDGTDSFEHVFRFVEESGLYDVQVTCLTPFPGTPLWSRLSEEGRLLSAEATERCTLFDINFRPTDMSVDELRNGFRELTRRLYAPEFVEQRNRRFREHLRAKVRSR